MRWLVLAPLLFAADASARKIVISEPPIVHACRSGQTWALVESCLAAQGKVRIERTLPKAKLVRILQVADKVEDDAGVYLYIQRADGSWSIGGMFEGAPYTIMDLTPLTLENHAGYRIDVGQILRTTTSLDGVTSIPVILSLKRVLFCGGDTYGCPDATTKCDVITHGKTLFTFRGTLAFEKGLVRVVGDRRLGGASCAASEQVFLGWPVGPAKSP
jgi:hypothetical protein